MAEYDYIIAGGGLCGCVLASRLKQAYPQRSIALLERGGDSREDEHVLHPGKAWFIGQDRYQDYITLPQKGLNNRTLPLRTGNVLGGGSAVNFGAWTRGDRDGYDEWGRVVGDQSWSYDGILPFLKRSETFPLRGREDAHGYDGPIKPSTGNRGYPLKDDVKNALVEAGLEVREEANGGDIIGAVPLFESWDGPRRTFAANEYDLTGVDILFQSQVHKVILEGTRATGVTLVDGAVLKATREVILSCGALRTPQVLMLSGIGSKEEIESLQIPLLLDAPGVGKNLHDHPMISLWYRLRHPEDGLAVGSPAFMSNPKFLEGNPLDWMVNNTATLAQKQKAAKEDGKLSERRDDFELTVMYMASPTNPYPAPQLDGSTITLCVFGMSTTSRGRVSLSSSNPMELPEVDIGYLTTAYDLAIMRDATRLALKIANTDSWKKICVGEVAPGHFAAFKSEPSDEELDDRIKSTAVTCYHYAGTASMGDVVDTSCRVKGIEGLRVLDSSVLPVSIAAHYQAVMYGVAEKGAQIIIDQTA